MYYVFSYSAARVSINSLIYLLTLKVGNPTSGLYSAALCQLYRTHFHSQWSTTLLTVNCLVSSCRRCEQAM